MKHFRAITFILLIFLTFSTSSLAQTESQREPTEEEIRASVQAFLESLDLKAGTVRLGDANATLSLGDGPYRYLDPDDTVRVLVNAWGNPPGMEVVGAIVPVGFDLIGEHTWAVVITYEEDGYVSDEDAGSLDYTELLGTMQEDTQTANEAREAEGYDAVELVGWAESPYYDSDSHKLYWAKELRFGDAPVNTLNYNIRALGRRGVLVLNAVGSMDQYVDISQAMQDILPLVTYSEGSRYVDFDPSIDQVAAYGIGALVAGKLAAKAGLLAKFAPLLLGLKKFGIVIVIGLGALATRFFKGRDDDSGGGTRIG